MMKELPSRVTKMWWVYFGEGRVVRVQGYSCAPTNPQSWWCPEVGYTGNEGHHLFETRDAAYDKAIQDTNWDIVTLKKQLDRLIEEKNNP